MSEIRVLLADDHGVLRKGVRSVLLQDPSIVVMDIAMPQLNGLEAAARIARRDRRTAVLILSMYSDEEYLVRALNAGVRGYLLKDSAEPDLVRAVRAVATGKTFFSPAIVDTLLEDYVLRLQQQESPDSYDLLTDREKQVLQLLAEGKTNKEVAGMLGLGVSTVETHRLNLMQKLNLHNTAELVLYAVKKKILRV
jgi:DNA-binding NarL/FixJ family response regulator